MVAAVRFSQMRRVPKSWQLPGQSNNAVAAGYQTSSAWGSVAHSGDGVAGGCGDACVAFSNNRAAMQPAQSQRALSALWTRTRAPNKGRK